jgi:hypothetical protein
LWQPEHCASKERSGCAFEALMPLGTNPAAYQSPASNSVYVFPASANWNGSGYQPSPIRVR